MNNTSDGIVTTVKAIYNLILRSLISTRSHEKPYHPSQMTRFRDPVCSKRLEEIMNKLILELVEHGEVKVVSIALDATFIKACSRRDLADNSHGYSDSERAQI